MTVATITTRFENTGTAQLADKNGRVLFIGVSNVSANHGNLQSIGPITDIDALLKANSSDADTPLITDLKAARANGRSGWSAYVLTHASNKDWSEAIDAVIDTANPEIIVFCEAVATKAKLEAITAKRKGYEQAGRHLLAIVALGAPAGDKASNAYVSESAAIVSGVVDAGTCLLPRLWGAEPGALAGRLNKNRNRAISPMKTKDAAVSLAGTLPALASGVARLSATDQAFLNQLQAQRLGTFQLYPNLEGVYFSNTPTLDSSSGDRTRIEIARVALSIAADAEFVGAQNIQNNNINNSPRGNALAGSLFMNILRQRVSDSLPSNHELLQPVAGDVIINWEKRGDIWVLKPTIKFRPINAAGSIEITLQIAQESA